METEIENGGIEELQARPYQRQLEEIAVQKNTIIHLPTGSGKTFIAIRLINRFRNVLKLPWGKGGKRTFFLVNTVPLVHQQKSVLLKLCAVESVGGYTGEDGVDYWDKSKWDAELAKHQVIVMTSQILADMLTHCYIRIDDINLLIFDECHHAVVDHPMRLVMKHFENYPVKAQPRVLGLTATLLNSNVAISKVEESLRELETTFHSTIATVDELGQVLRYSTNPHEIIKYFNSPRLTPAAKEAIAMLRELQTIVMNCRTPVVKSDLKIILERGQRELCSDPKKFNKDIKNLLESMISFIEELGVYGGALGIVASTITMERLKRKYIMVEEENILKLCITHSTMARMVLLNSMPEDDEYKKILKHSSEKVLLLLNVLKEYNPKYYTAPGVLLTVNIAKKPLSGIIFTQTRFTALVLYNLLKAVKEANPTDFGFLNLEFIVGFNINPFKRTREQYYTKKASQKALLSFRNKESNCLIATNVIEEGVDIQQCLLVLRYDPPKEYRSYIQSKGRARSAESSFVMLINAENKNKFMQQYHTFQSTEDYIQRILIGNTDFRDAPTLDDIDGLYSEDEVPPYITPHGSRLSAVQAPSLLHRYCSLMPHDQFTTITPLWIEESVESRSLSILKQVKLYMPLGCPIKDIIEGPPLSSLKAAKRAAALNACIRLHQEGELDPITLLPRQYITVDFDQTDVKECFPNWPWEEVEDTDFPKPGTKKRARKYPKVFPTHLKGPENWTSGEQNFYLHIIKLKTNFKEPTDSRERVLYELLGRDEGFGLLTISSLPKICDFPMFLSVGEVTTSIKMNYAVIALTPQLFQLVKSFHYFLFDRVLEVGKKFVVFDGTENSIYVVPVKSCYGDYDIDWTAMQNYTVVEPVVEPSTEERKSLHVTEETYKYHVVTPWYRYAHHPYRYIVSNVLEYMTPKSRFESTGDSTYADYYSCKYNLKIEGDQEQPLLEVRNINTRMNCLVPRAATIRAFSEKQKKEISLVQGDDKPKGFQEVLIPEFCIKHEFPGVFWFKALMLPSIIHRIYMLLVAYELRYEIAIHTKVGQAQLTSGQEWLPIEVNIQTAMKSLLALIEDHKPITAIDRINHPVDEHAPHQAPKVLSMMDSLIKLQKKKISDSYDWDERAEPIDIERNIATVTVMDIECYEAFVSLPVNEKKQESSFEQRVCIPPRPAAAAAILPPPVKLVTKIALLSKKPNIRGPELRDVLSAITTIGSLETLNLERVETLGDSFLKFSSTVYLFYKFPKYNEGQLTNIRCRFVGNRNLYYAGAKARLGGRMKVEGFMPSKDFLVPGFFAPKEIQDIIEEKQIRPTCLIKFEFSPEEALSGRLSDESRAMIKEKFSGEDEGSIELEPVGGAQAAMQCYVQAQAVSDKTVADCVEALLGTYLLSNGITAAVKVMEWLKIMPAKDNFARYLTRSMPTILTEKITTEEEIDRIMNHCRDDVEKLLNYKFKDPSLLLQAVTHHSYMRNRLTGSYERLEFLGDAILDFLITSHIFEACPDMQPGDLTDLKSALVNNVTFASYIVRKGLHKYLCYNLNPALESAIIAFIEHQELNNHAIVEEVLYLIDEEDCQIAEYTEVPKILSDLFESLAGAVYLDSRGDLETVWKVFYPIMCKEIHEFSRCIPQQPVRVLYEQVYACPMFGDAIVPDSNILKVLVPVTVTKNGKECTVYGQGHNKSQAKRAAAKIALKVLGM